MPPRDSGQFGPDIVVGSAQYAKKWREKNKERALAIQQRYRLKQKSLIHTIPLSEIDETPDEETAGEFTNDMASRLEEILGIPLDEVKKED